MKILILVYEGFAEFEITFLGYVAREEKNEVVTVAPDDTPQVRGMGGLMVTSDLRLGDVEPGEYAALIIPGGTPESIFDREEVGALIRRFHEAGKLVAAICMGPVHLAKAGMLAGRPFTTSASQNYRDVFEWHRKVDDPVVVDGKIITAKGEAFVNFAFTVMEQLGAYQNKADAPRWRQEFGA